MKQVKTHLNLKEEAFRQIEKMHPHKVLLFVSMTGSALIFLFMAVAFSASPLEMLKDFWHFTSALWLVLFLYFFFIY